jgi:heat shock protein HtpX
MWFNRIKTAVLLAALSSVFMLLGYCVGGYAGIQIAFAFAMLMNGITYFYSDKIVLWMYGAKPLDSVRYAWIYDTISELAHTMELPMPKVWFVDTPMANAFATGRNPKHASIAVTAGILAILEPHELRGVLAHELSHIKNRDILITTIAATLATAIGYVATMLRHAAFWGSFDNNRRKESGNPLFMLFVSLLMPLAASLIQLAISRSREYLADETGAHACRDPLALASALEKLHNHTAYAHMDENDARRASTAPLFIVHPFTTDGLIALFSTHPPVRKRVQRLHKICEKMF